MALFRDTHVVACMPHHQSSLNYMYYVCLVNTVLGVTLCVCGCVLFVVLSLGTPVALASDDFPSILSCLEGLDGEPLVETGIDGIPLTKDDNIDGEPSEFAVVAC